MKSNLNLPVNHSSLICLQAEVARKREELKQHVFTEPKKTRKLELKHEIQLEVEKKPSVKVETKNDKVDEKDLHEYCKKSLIAKSQLYDKLRNKDLVTEDSERFLVDFSSKLVNNLQEIDNWNSESEWVDYVDSLGRSRTCLRKDLSYYKNLDVELNGTDPDENSDDKESVPLTKHTAPTMEYQLWDMKREELRLKWEEEEKRIAGKMEVHYQDVLCDEARSHGVGYFGFSTDETERKRQQEELLKMHEETEKNQKQTMSLKEKREQQMKARLAAARKRKREQMGLPAEPEPESEEKTEIVENTVQESGDAKESSVDANLESKVEEYLEKMRRAAHIRPWDIGKDGVKNKVMSSEEWIEKQRSVRVEEFAPIYQPENNVDEETSNRTLYFTSKKRLKKANNVKCKVPIDFEYTHDDSDQQTKDECKNGAEIPPPTSYEYDSKSAGILRNSCIRDSLEAGIKYMEKETELKRMKRSKGMLEEFV